MAKFKPYKILESQLDSLPIKEGQFILTTDTKKLYSDTAANTRILISPDAITDLSVNGTTITYTRLDGTTGTITTKDTTYSVASETKNGLMSSDDKAKLNAIESGAQKNTVTGIKGDSETLYRTGNVNITKSNIGLNNVENKSSATIRGELTNSNVTTALGYTPLNSNLKGANNGLAELDASGKVPTSQLPSYVDDVLEYSSRSIFPSSGEAGKIYVDASTNKTYRWGGSAYVEISQSLALGTTSSTAFRGDYGDTAYQHANKKGSEFYSGFYKIGTNAEGHVTSATYVTKEDITALGIPAQDTTYGTATSSVNGLMSFDDKNKLLNIEAGAQKNKVHGVKGSAETEYRTGNINITKANIGLGNVENKSSATIRSELTQAEVANALGYLPPRTDTNTTYEEATPSTGGLMSAADKHKMDSIEKGAQVNTITGVKGSAESTYRTGNVSITKANIGLGNVDNTADVNKSVKYAKTAGDAETVNGLTVETAVPANAKFTDNNTTYTFATGDANGQIKVTPSGGSAQNVSVKGLGSLAYKSSLAASDVGAIASTSKGAANGVAELDANGKVPTAQLPSYVDDVLEYSAKSAFPTRGETGKIYIDQATNKTYRWSGSAYAEISASLALGTTSSTAFRGDYGQETYNHAIAKGSAFSSGLYKITTNEEGHIIEAIAVDKEDITALGIPAENSDTTYTLEQDETDKHILTLTPSEGAATTIVIPDSDTTYEEATSSTAGLMSAADKVKLDEMPELDKVVVSSNESVENIVSLTKAEYDALEEKEVNTLYNITDDDADDSNGVPQEGIIAYDGDEIPEGYEEEDTFISDMANLFFPIGYTFIDTTGEIDYSNHLGLTWEKTLQGVTPIGQNTSDTDFATVGKTGGEKTHTLTINEMPSHNHIVNLNYAQSDLEVQTMLEHGFIINSGHLYKTPGATWNGGTTYFGHTSSIGSNKAHNIMQPYQVVTFWTRVG